MTLPSIEPYVTIWFRGFALGPLAIGFARLSIGWIFHVGWLYRRHRWQRCEWGFVSVEHLERLPMTDYLVTVCAECLRASCWHGEFLCDTSRGANVREMRASELDALNREHPREHRDYYSREKILEVTGSLPKEVV